MNWGLLSPASSETIRKARMMTGRFTGDPSYECEHRSETEEDVLVRDHFFLTENNFVVYRIQRYFIAGLAPCVMFYHNENLSVKRIKRYSD